MHETCETINRNIDIFETHFPGSPYSNAVDEEMASAIRQNSAVPIKDRIMRGI